MGNTREDRIEVATKAVAAHEGKGSRLRRARQDAVKPVADSKSRRYDPAETRARVLEAAYMLFGTRGYANTGTADIAAQADVSEGSIFYHFGSKRALLVELGKLHGQKMTKAMQGEDSLHSLTFEVTITRCFDFAEQSNVWEEVVHDGTCPPVNKMQKKNPEAEPFFHAAKEYVVGWTKAHLEAVAAQFGPLTMDTTVAANLIFALVGEAMQHYFDPDAKPEDRLRIRTECIRFSTAAAGHPAIEGPAAHA
ncbi:MAG: TetR/AcrR family transcriptional regulator [Sandaracinobacteroides sp.]